MCGKWYLLLLSLLFVYQFFGIADNGICRSGDVCEGSGICCYCYWDCYRKDDLHLIMAFVGLVNHHCWCVCEKWYLVLLLLLSVY